MKVANVVGTRPNFMKIMPLMDEYAKHKQIEPLLVHTGQHYDETMSGLFFRQLEIPQPDINLRVGSGSHAVQAAEIMKAFETVVLEHRPDVVLVVGDVNSTVACGLVAVKLGIRLVHVEAGLRSFDRSMPEEINRVLTDSVSDLLFCSEQSGVDNLVAEGISEDKIFLVGNIMIETLLKNKAKAENSDILNQLKIDGNGFTLLTLHRPASVDDPKVLFRILDALDIISNDMPMIFPVHPRTREKLGSMSLARRVDAIKGLRLICPAGYFDFLKLMSSAKIVLTDSGGIQEETTALRVPCLTMRENTERPVTVEIGSNQIVGTDPEIIVAEYRRVMSGNRRVPQVPPLWDRKVAKRVVKIMQKEFS